MVEKGKSMMSREERSHMRHRAHTRSSLAGGKARGRRTSGGQNESSPRILPKPDAYQCTIGGDGNAEKKVFFFRLELSKWLVDDSKYI